MKKLVWYWAAAACDGSEIHEAVITLLAIAQRRAGSVLCAR